MENQPKKGSARIPSFLSGVAAALAKHPNYRFGRKSVWVGLDRARPCAKLLAGPADLLHNRRAVPGGKLMKVRFATLTAATLFAAALTMAADGSWTGWISDSQCGVKGANDKPANAPPSA